ncbi:MAG: hypothetical protein ABIP20_21145 [Chthoniobacteraceae bacterium]
MNTTSHKILADASRVRKQALPLRPSRGRWLAFAASLAALLLLTPADTRAEYNWIGFAGQDSGIGTADGYGSESRFSYPEFIAVDVSGNIYVTDAGANTVRKITPAGQIGNVVTLAGQAGVFNERDGIGLRAQFADPEGVAVAPNGDVYVADIAGQTIRKITPAGVVTTFAGRASTPGTTDGDRLAARFTSPIGLVLDSVGNFYVADSGSGTIRKIAPNGQVTTFAGSPGWRGSADGTGTLARFADVFGLAVDAANNVYVTDTGNHNIRKITPAGVVTTIGGTAGSAGMVDGPRAQARFHTPVGVAVSPQGIVYVSEAYNTTIRMIAPDGTVTSLPPSIWAQEPAGYPRNFNHPAGLAIDATGALLVADSVNRTVRRVSNGIAVAYAGLPGAQSGKDNGSGYAARFNYPQGTIADSSGNVYVADTFNGQIRKITPAGIVTTFAGESVSNSQVDGVGTHAGFAYPTGMAINPAGTLFVADSGFGSIRKITTPGAVVTTVPIPRILDQPLGIAVDAAGNIYVAETPRCVIDKITPAGVFSVFAGIPYSPGSNDGPALSARFNQPSGVAVNAAGEVFVTDSDNHTIRKISPAGVVSTLAGWPGRIGNTDGTGTSAQFYQPRGIKLDTDGSLVVADTSNHMIRRVTMAGVVTTLGGFPGAGGHRPGIYRDAHFSTPFDVAIAPGGLIYVAETAANVIAVGTSGARLTVFAYASLPGSTTAFANGVLLLAGSTFDLADVRRGATSVAAFSMSDTGFTTFNNLKVTIDGPNAADFTVTTLPDPYVTPLGETSFRITFRPAQTGPRSANVHFTSTGGGINSFDFRIIGNGVP